MASRIVVTYFGGRAAEINSDDAGALVASRKWRVSLTKFSGPLRDATVLVRERPSPEYEVTQVGIEQFWRRTLAALGSYREFTLPRRLPTNPRPVRGRASTAHARARARSIPEPYVESVPTLR